MNDFIRQFLAESLALASLGGILGIALAWALLKIILLMMPPFTLPYEANVRLHHRGVRPPLRPGIVAAPTVDRAVDQVRLRRPQRAGAPVAGLTESLETGSIGQELVAAAYRRGYKSGGLGAEFEGWGSQGAWPEK